MSLQHIDLADPQSSRRLPVKRLTRDLARAGIGEIFGRSVAGAIKG